MCRICTTLPFIPKVFLLSLFSDLNLINSETEIISVLLALAQTTIATKWKDRTVPSIKNWYDKIIDPPPHD